MAQPTNDRIIGVLLAGLGLLGLLWVRCVWLQAVARHRYAAVAASQHQSRERVLARRGAIYDRQGHTLAVSLPTPSVFANARRVTDKPHTARRLADAVGKDAGRIRERLGRDKGFVWVARQVDLAAMPAILTMRDE